MSIIDLLAPLSLWNVIVTTALCIVWVRRGLAAVEWVERRRKAERDELSRQSRDTLATSSRESHEVLRRSS